MLLVQKGLFSRAYLIRLIQANVLFKIWGTGHSDDVRRAAVFYDYYFGEDSVEVPLGDLSSPRTSLRNFALKVDLPRMPAGVLFFVYQSLFLTGVSPESNKFQLLFGKMLARMAVN